MKTILKIPGGSGTQMTTFLRKLGLVSVDGSPNEIYRKFRNPVSSGAAIATVIRNAYAALYARNEFMHQLGDNELVGLIVEETGEPHDSNPVKLVASCIKHLKAFADFNTRGEVSSSAPVVVDDEKPSEVGNGRNSTGDKSIGFSLGYTINLNLPATSDPAVFDAIFKALKAHLLRSDDA